MEEERIKSLQREIARLTKTAAEESAKVNQARNELAKLETDKEAFLAKRREEELLLLADTAKKLEEAREQLSFWRELKTKEEENLKKSRENLKKEQLHLDTSKREAEQMREDALITFRHSVSAEKRTLDKLENAEKTELKAKCRLDDAEAIKADAIRGLERLKNDRKKLETISQKNDERTHALSRWERDLKKRETKVISDLNQAKKLNEETKKLVLWHKG